MAILVTVTQAKQILEERLQKGKPVRIHLSESLGKVLAESIVSPMDVPSFDNSAMDGYALQYREGQNTWEVKAVVQAGDSKSYSTDLHEAVRIYTGAKMPLHTDTVIPQELIELDNNTNAIHYRQAGIKKGDNVRYQGEQCKRGDKVIEAGTVIRPGILGLLATLGIAEVSVYPSPVVGCIITGNELKELGEPLQAGEIYNSNGLMLLASLKAMNIEKVRSYRVRDDESLLFNSIKNALEENDCLILSGGISVGDYDFVRAALEQLGVHELIYKIRQRPGKPMLIGQWQGKWVFALPGNPASVASCFHHYVRPCLKYYMGHEHVWKADRMLPLADGVKKNASLTLFMKARHNGQLVHILKGQQSFNMLPFVEANCFAELPEEVEELPAGTMVNIFDWE